MNLNLNNVNFTGPLLTLSFILLPFISDRKSSLIILQTNIFKIVCDG